MSVVNVNKEIQEQQMNIVSILRIMPKNSIIIDIVTSYKYLQHLIKFN